MPTERPLNEYGDTATPAGEGFGVDISAQRRDDLDALALGALARTQAPLALDAGCGYGGMAVEMACAGAEVVAVDRQDFREEIDRLFAQRRVERIPPTFIQGDLRNLDSLPLPHERYDVIVCQRTLHYLQYTEAMKAAAALQRRLKPRGFGFISVSGIESELGHGYEGTNAPLAERFFTLEQEQAGRHHIRQPVCLYSMAEFCVLLADAGFGIERAFTSAFGNLKVVVKAS